MYIMNVKETLMNTIGDMTNRDNVNIFFIENINHYNKYSEDTPISAINTNTAHTAHTAHTAGTAHIANTNEHLNTFETPPRYTVSTSTSIPLSRRSIPIRYTSRRPVHEPYNNSTTSNFLYSDDTKEDDTKEDDSEEESNYADMPPLIQINDQNNTGNSMNQTYIESPSLNNIQNMIDSILGTIPNMPNELSIEFPINNLPPVSQLNSIENINNQSYLITVNEHNKHTYIHEECSICNINYNLEDIVRKFDKCPHYFHYKCIDRWLNTNKNCPICTINII